QPSAFPTGGTLLDSISSSFSGSSSSGVLIGTLTSAVYSGDASNPYGGLTFTYLLTMNGASTDNSSGFTLDGFSGRQTDVSYNLTGTEIAPSPFTRSSAGSGTTIRSPWFIGGGLQPGQTGALIVVQPDAHVYGGSLGSVSAGQPVAQIGILTAVPEPGT